MMDFRGGPIFGRPFRQVVKKPPSGGFLLPQEQVVIIN